MNKNRRSSLRQTFGANLRREGEARGLSEEDLTCKAGLYRLRIDAVERGERNIAVDDIERLARALKLGPADLLE